MEGGLGRLPSLLFLMLDCYCSRGDTEVSRYESFKVLVLLLHFMDLRGFVPFPSQKRRFIVLESAYVIATSRHIHKRELKDRVFRLRDEGLSLREIAREVGLHWTRVWQILQ